jgi:hypothetical protein
MKCPALQLGATFSLTSCPTYTYCALEPLINTERSVSFVQEAIATKNAGKEQPNGIMESNTAIIVLGATTVTVVVFGEISE